MLDHLMQPIRIGSMTVPNRVMMTTHGPRLSQERYLRYLEERVRNDVGLVGLSAGAGVSTFPFGPGRSLGQIVPEGDGIPPDPLSSEGIAFYDSLAIPMLRAQADVVHRHGACCVGQVLHTGANLNNDGFQPAVAPSVVQDEFRRHVPHALTTPEIERLVTAFGHAGRRVEEAGLDGIEIHGAHGYLVNQFLSPYTNHRTDAYGGDDQRRLRFAMEVLGAIRSNVSDEFPVGIRLNGSDLVHGGLDSRDAVQIAVRLAAAGVDFINVSAGTYSGLRNGLGLAYVAPSVVATGHNLPFAAAISQEVDVPVIVAGRIIDLEQADRWVGDGLVDMIGLTRALIADPAIVRKTREGRAHRVTRCIACNECHAQRAVSCPVNPAAGREAEAAPRPVRRRKRLLIAGGGPAGMEAARRAAARGHEVVLCERAPALGGALALISQHDPERPEFGGYIAHLARELREAGVDVRASTEVTPSLVADVNPDAVAIATGATEHVPDVSGIDAAHVSTAFAAMALPPPPSAHVAVVGGLDDHLPPLTVACHLATRVRRVTLISEQLAPGEGVEAATRLALMKRLLDRGVAIQALSRLTAVGDGTLTLTNTLTRTTTTLEGIDAVVLACGRRARVGLADALTDQGRDVTVIGDALSPRRLLHATLDGARWGSAI